MDRMIKSAKKAISLKANQWLILLMILITIGLLITGWFLPTLKLTKAIFFTEEYSIWMGIVELFKTDHFFLAFIIFFFSMVFPLLKLVLLFIVCVYPLKQNAKVFLLNWLGKLGKWSMLDVYVVSIIIVLIKLKDVIGANASAGIYVFAAAIILSMLLTMRIEKIVRV